MGNKVRAILSALIWALIGIVASLLLYSFIQGNNPFPTISYKTKTDVLLYDKTLSDDIDVLNIEWAAGGVTLLPSDDGKLHVIERATAKIPENQWATFDQNGKTLHLKSNTRGIFLFFWNSPISSLEVRLPEAEYEALKLEATSGAYLVSDLKFKRIDTEMTSGDLDFTRLSVDTLNLYLTSGQAVLNALDVNDATLQNTSGSLTYQGSIHNSLTSEMTSGEQDLTLEGPAPVKLAVSLTSGQTTLSLSQVDGFRLTLDKTSGNFDADFAHTQSENTYTYGNGAYDYRAEMTSGSLRISVKE